MTLRQLPLPARRDRFGETEPVRPPANRLEHPNLERPGAHPATPARSRQRPTRGERR
jgi:hypothetical protein